MGISLKPQRLARYKDVALLLRKYGRRDLVEAAGLAGALENGTPAAADLERPTAELAGELADDLERLGPTFIKVGQFLSTRTDLLPPAYAEALTRLQDQVKPFPFAEVETIVERELGVRLSKAFATFEPEPIAAASLGQVHRAVLRDGRRVAVKVQRPDIVPRVLEDLEVLDEIARFLDGHTETGRRYRFALMVDELRRALVRELDYRLEARNLNVLGGHLAEFGRILVPRPVDDYVTPRVLAMDYVCGKKVTSVGPLGRMEVDGAALAEELTRAYLHQVLVVGFFHADPHPGNVFLTDDRRIALLDLGMVAQISSAMQDQLLKLLLAVSEGRGDDAASIALRIGERAPENFDVPGFRRGVNELVVGLQGMSLQQIQIGRVVMEVGRIAARHELWLPSELTLLGKTLLNVDRVATHIAPGFDPNASIRRNAAEILNRRVRKKLSPGKLFAGLLELMEFAEKLPGRLNTALDGDGANPLRIKVDAIDETTLMVGMQKVANRITLGLVLSALIVGAALLMRVETPFRIFGYPGLAILCFLVAAIAGLWLVTTIMVGDWHERGGGKPG
jgi:predicted unusual protein kinase regulating ubiquinone biosynthesis (AarF/ABC1/UbiB family)